MFGVEFCFNQFQQESNTRISALHLGRKTNRGCCLPRKTFGIPHSFVNFKKENHKDGVNCKLRTPRGEYVGNLYILI